MGKWFCCVILFWIGLTSLSCADDETAKRLFITCSQNADLFACDELVYLPELDDSTRSNAYTARSIALTRHGDLEGAVQDVEEALRLDPTNATALRVRELIAKVREDRGVAFGSGCFDKSDLHRLQACDQLVSESPIDPPQRAAALDARAAAFMDTDQFDKAIADLSLGRKLMPNQPQLVEHLMIAKFWAGDIAGGLKENETALAFPGADGNGQLHSYRGSLLYLAGKLDAAGKEFSRAASMGPEFVVSQYWTAVIRTEQGSDATRIFRFLADDPMQGPFANSLAKLRLGEVSGEDVLDQAAQITGSEGKDALCLAHFHIGHQAWLAGDNRTAREHFEAALVDKRRRTLEYHAAKMLLEKL